jgi:Serine/threonine protein kinase
VFRRICETVGYAHDRGVLHRDLKPDNVMLGPHGEVFVLDWGLAKVMGQAGTALRGVETVRSRSDALATQVGRVAGTPAFMAPEQARGAVDELDARTDVYALGAVLYHLLAGRRPYTGASTTEVVAQVLAGPPPPLPTGPEDAKAVPVPLAAACSRAMSRERDARYPTAGALADEVAAWLDGARRAAQGRAVVDAALSRGPRVDALRAEAASMRAKAAALLADVDPWQPEADKLPGWELEDAAAAKTCKP